MPPQGVSEEWKLSKKQATSKGLGPSFPAPCGNHKRLKGGPNGTSIISAVSQLTVTLSVVLTPLPSCAETVTVQLPAATLLIVTTAPSKLIVAIDVLLLTALIVFLITNFLSASFPGPIDFVTFNKSGTTNDYHPKLIKTDVRNNSPHT